MEALFKKNNLIGIISKTMNIKYHNLVKKSTVLGVIFALFLPGVILAQVPTDPEYLKQKSMYDIIKVPDAWEYTTGSKDVIVAVIDVGVDIENPDLKDNIWVNKFEIPNNNKDDDNNGFIDDVNGWNFVKDNNSVRPSVDDDWLSNGVANHGTIVSGLIGAKANNDESGTGINWDVKIMPIVAIDVTGGGSYSQIVSAINYAVNNGANVINLSMTSDYDSKLLKDAVYNAYKKGVVVVAAGGNNLQDLSISPVYPICSDASSTKNWVLGVGAMTNTRYSTVFSNYGKCIDLYAPGELIYSTERWAPLYNFPNKFGGPWQGTSFASPLVSGAAALVKAIRPDWTADKIIKALTIRTDLTEDQKKRASGIAVNVLDAVKYASDSLKISPIYRTEYYIKGNEIYKQSSLGGNNKYVTKIKNGQIISADFKNVYGDYNDEVAVLYKINGFYYVRILSDKKVLRDFSLNVKSLGFNPKILKFAVNESDDSVYLLLSDGKTKPKTASFGLNGLRF